MIDTLSGVVYGSINVLLLMRSGCVCALNFALNVALAIAYGKLCLMYMSGAL